ncbi:hypothetical protein [Embleya scabrispora]|nr:hypothetical protein [Embleya scabrispora]
MINFAARIPSRRRVRRTHIHQEREEMRKKIAATLAAGALTVTMAAGLS